jgi:hypothetical protein
MRVVEMGGAEELLNVLEGAKDDKTRKEALKALIALSMSGDSLMPPPGRSCTSFSLFVAPKCFI